ncbi:restriction endonuclease subunit S [Flavobacterium sp. XS2P14]|uniref:restriction endonuclease subunit S n=1 Tax=Flavobacterium sp. XS2P14 TaxID=3401735 RepID=UPI003AAE17A9
MPSNYKRLGDYIQEVNIRNRDLSNIPLLGVSIRKVLMPSIANIIGTDMSTYKLIQKNQFAYGPVTSRNGDKISIALLEEYDSAMVSQAYTVFEIIDEIELSPEYLMMWFRRPEFDRYARFKSHGSAREIFSWTEIYETLLPIPSIVKQQEIVREYHTIQNRIALNNQLISKLEETAQAIYKQWFVDFEFPDENGILDDYVEFNPKHSISKNVMVSYIEMADLQENSLCIKNSIKREFSAGSKFKNEDTLLARITPCLENGKTGFVNILKEGEIAFGSTEFIVMRPKDEISPFWVYCLAKDENFRLHAISSMVGSSGRQRVHSDYLKEYILPKIDFQLMEKFDKIVNPVFEKIKLKNIEKNLLLNLNGLLLSKMTKVETETHILN